MVRNTENKLKELKSANLVNTDAFTSLREFNNYTNDKNELSLY